jgi:hypothetical protein
MGEEIMAKFRFLPFNVLNFDTTAVAVTGTADSGYPEARLYDHSIDFYWKYTATGDITILADQGAGIDWPVVNTLIIERHNFTGRTITWEYSDNGADWHDMIASWAQGDNLQIVKESTETSAHRYLRLVVSGAVNPQCSEVYMGGYYEFPIRFDDAPKEKDVDNVIWTATLGGIERSNKLGDVRRGRIYSLFLYPEALVNWREAIAYLDEFSKPFYIRDHENDYWFARFRELPGGTFVTEQQQEKEIELLEIL